MIIIIIIVVVIAFSNNFAVDSCALLCLWTPQVAAQGPPRVLSAAEAQRVHVLLSGLGCFDNNACLFKDFTELSTCDFKGSAMGCNALGQLQFM
jgi:hypothetical protein